MIKKGTLLLAILAVIIASYSLILSTNTKKQAYVDVNRLIAGYKRTALVKSTFEKKAGLAKANIDSLITNWQKELQSYEKNRSMMSKKELTLQQRLLKNKQQQVENYKQAVQKQLQEEDQNNTQTVINDINDFVKNYGKKHDYSMIFGASGQGNIMYANEITDITAAVLEALNNDFEGT